MGHVNIVSQLMHHGASPNTTNVVSNRSPSGMAELGIHGNIWEQHCCEAPGSSVHRRGCGSHGIHGEVQPVGFLTG